jgi:hypothetical protein
VPSLFELCANGASAAIENQHISPQFSGWQDFDEDGVRPVFYALERYAETGDKAELQSLLRLCDVRSLEIVASADSDENDIAQEALYQAVIRHDTDLISDIIGMKATSRGNHELLLYDDEPDVTLPILGVAAVVWSLQTDGKNNHDGRYLDGFFSEELKDELVYGAEGTCLSVIEELLLLECDDAAVELMGRGVALMPREERKTLSPGDTIVLWNAIKENEKDTITQVVKKVQEQRESSFYMSPPELSSMLWLAVERGFTDSAVYIQTLLNEKERTRTVAEEKKTDETAGMSGDCYEAIEKQAAQESYQYFRTMHADAGIDEERLKTYGDIRGLFHNIPKCLKLLSGLSTELSERLPWLDGAVYPDEYVSVATYPFPAAPLPNSDVRDKKKDSALSKRISERLQRHGLEGDIDTYEGFIPTETANERVYSGRLFKEGRTDVGVIHGKYSHLLQWVIIGEAVQEGILTLPEGIGDVKILLQHVIRDKVWMTLIDNVDFRKQAIKNEEFDPLYYRLPYVTATDDYLHEPSLPLRPSFGDPSWMQAAIISLNHEEAESFSVSALKNYITHSFHKSAGKLQQATGMSYDGLLVGLAHAFSGGIFGSVEFTSASKLGREEGIRTKSYVDALNESRNSGIIRGGPVS